VIYEDDGDCTVFSTALTLTPVDDAYSNEEVGATVGDEDISKLRARFNEARLARPIPPAAEFTAE
jgi:hypothetical protein